MQSSRLSDDDSVGRTSTNSPTAHTPARPSVHRRTAQLDADIAAVQEPTLAHEPYRAYRVRTAALKPAVSVASHDVTAHHDVALPVLAASTRAAKRHSWRLWLYVLPFLVLSLLFCYIPLFGWIYAFYDYQPPIPLSESEFVGLQWFEMLVQNPAQLRMIGQVLLNTFAMSSLNIVSSFLPVIFAIMLNEIRVRWFKNIIQTLTTLPNFISWVLVYSIAFAMFSSRANYQGMQKGWFAKIGYPEIKNLTDFANVLKQMQDKAREETGDNSIYAVSLFKDWDAELMQNAQSVSQWLGYSQQNSLLVSANEKDPQIVPATEQGSAYDTAIEFLNLCNTMGIVDPESTTQNWDMLSTKVTNGKVLMSIWSWLGKPRMNSDDNQAKGIGFMLAPVQSMNVYSLGFQPKGDGNVFIAIGSKAKHKERLAKFIDWLYSSEGMYAGAMNSGGAACPKDMCWTLNDKGEPQINDLGYARVLEVDERNAKELIQARQEIMQQFADNHE